MNGFEKRRLSKMENILDAAKDLFLKQGVQKVNIKQIAKKANVSQVTIYNYFGSKEKLLVEVIRSMLETQMAEFSELFYSKKPFEEKIEQFIKLKIHFSREMNEDFLFLLMSENKEIRDLYNRFAEKEALPFFKAFVDQGKSEGVIREDLSFDSILFYINAFSNEAFKQPELFKDPQSRNTLAIDLNQLFFYGISGKK
ncbi:TetR/AcrR family transcriptional regulator [Metabacillus sp. 84]|uniref:TetR/AcrR family transcriptional regulator n=1 Tax=unclassified Metabacillus TaxID=2675274 RepID=UPI003CF119F5